MSPTSSWRARLRARLLALRAKLAPVVRPVLHTFWQSFVGLVGIWWFASGVDAWGQITDVASAKRFTLSLFAAAAAAALSAVKNTIKQWLTPKPAK